MLDYKSYYKYCKDKYQGNFKNLLPLKNLSVFFRQSGSENFDWPIDYQKSITSIRNYCEEKINNRQGLFDLNHKNIVKIDNYHDSKEIHNLGNFFCNYVEDHVYGCHAIVEAVLIYKSLPNEIERSSWIWHYDDSPEYSLKLMVYLNDVKDNTGAFNLLLNKDEQGLVLKSSKISPNRSSSQVYPGSRVPNHEIEKFKNSGFREAKIVGDAGTFCLFTPNCIHKATVPEAKPHRLCMIYNIRPYHKKIDAKINKQFTRTWSNLQDIKTFNTSIS